MQLKYFGKFLIFIKKKEDESCKLDVYCHTTAKY